MKAATVGVIGLLFAVIFIVIAIPEVSSLQDSGEALTGNLPLVWDKVTGIFVIIGGTVAIGTLIGGIFVFLNR